MASDSIVKVNSFIRLTNAFESQSGWLWSRMVTDFRSSSQPLYSENWMTEFEFQLGAEHYEIPADGLAFWFTTQSKQQGPVFGSFF